MSSYSVRLQDLPSIPLAVVRRRVTAAELSKVVPECCGLVWNALKAQGVKAGHNVAIYWNGDIRLEVGVELKGPFEEQHAVVRSATPAGPAAFVTHFGPYGNLGAAHQAVRTWCEANGHRLAGPNWEIYGHWEEKWNSDPTLITTDVFYQIASP
ncbi:MAG TPA: GyrI-like domain-containing protein [Gemmatimonadaceae bacterium]|nr:GyrI-like domain-containing protein [Gemmatimonadaceae bacterium]